jgi:DNA repair exonuclease SbcCD ATPase subunit
MNPASSPNIAASRPNASSAIQSAHAALTEKAREAFLSNPSPLRNESPERSLIKGAAHKRMQSIQTGSVRDLSSFLEGGSIPASPSRPSERSPEKNRPTTPYTSRDFAIEAKSPEKETGRSVTPTPTSATAGRDTPTLRPSLRRPPQSILGENTPPQSATMMALHSMSTRDTDSPLSNVTNGSTALVRTPQTFDAISNQILSLTSIATSLQREMAQLSRRSKDNATDLVSLKEATNARDEDIRKSLRELVSNLSKTTSRSSSDIFGSGGFMLDNKPHTPSSKGFKPISLPRIPSPNSFSASLDRESTASPMPYHTDGTATIALLEKIIRDMGTKEGQENIVARLAEVTDRLAKDGASTTEQVNDLLQQVKKSIGNGALVPHNFGRNGNGNGTAGNHSFGFEEGPRLELDFDQHQSGPMVSRVENLLGVAGNKENRGEPGTSRASSVINDDILKLIRSVKDSVAQGGGLTAEVKALVRELRGEVLGMGREIGRKLDQASAKGDDAEDAADEKERIARIVQDGLEELKQHMDRVMREARRQSSSSTVSRATVDGQEIYNAVKCAMADMQAAQYLEKTPQDIAFQKNDIIEAVKEAWESYKPDIELQHFGLEREELLDCLKEGIQQYAPQDNAREIGGATREEVFTAVVEGLKHFSPPRVETEASLTREEILDAVRECLEEFEFPVAPSAVVPREVEITREDMLDAVKEGLHSFDFPSHRVGNNRDVDSSAQLNGYGEEVVERLQEIMDFMRDEFKAVSDEAKQNVAANGRDTEQVLDATKDGLEKLRADIESYVDRAADITGRDEILDTMSQNFRSLRTDIELLTSKGTEDSLEGVKRELEQLRESMATSIVPSNMGTQREEILSILKDGLDGLRADLDRPRESNESILSGTGEILDALHDGLTGLRAEVEKIGSKPVDMTVNYEILDTLRAGLEGVRADIDRLREDNQSERQSEHNSEREVAAITNGAVVSADGLKRNDIENLEVLITQLRIKVEAMESMPPPPPQAPAESVSRDDFANVEEALKDVQTSIANMSTHSRSIDEDTVRKEDVEAIETLLRNTKAKIDDMDPEQIVKKDQMDAVEALLRETQSTVNELASHLMETSKREDVAVIEAMMKEISSTIVELKEKGMSEETTAGLVAIETVCLNIREQMDQLASKDEVKDISNAVKEFAENNSKAFDERQAEIVGVGERVSEVKSFLEEFKEAIRERLDEGNTGVEALGKFLEGMGETINQNANITEDIKVLSETIKAEFGKSNAGVVGVKLESDEKFQKTWDKFEEKMEEKFNELMLKYDDAQLAAEATTKAGDTRAAEAEGAVLATKAIAEDLKNLIDTLGTTLTESVDKTDEASKTVFNRVEDTFNKVGELHADIKVEHQVTREQLSNTLRAVEGVQGSIGEYHPKILESIKDVLLIVGQHYEHSRTATETIQEKIAEKAAIPNQPLLQETPAAEKYDDAQVHEKLDKLVDHMHAAGKSFAQLDMLDQIHQRVMQTAAEVSEFVSAQTQRIANDHEDKEKAVEVATIALEKRLAQKERVEAEVVGLREDEDRLKESVSALKAEQEDLAHQKMRLAADVSSLETALRIRREELHAMEARAEGLERRILEGVIDHSRALLISKSNKGRDAMNLKRVPSHATSTTGSMMSYATSGSRSSHATQSAVSMAMGGNRAVNSNPINNPAGASRRNFSLNQITNNVPNGGFKRSHSVKAPGGSGALRKTSWGGALSRQEYGDLNKENLALKENDEDSDNVSDSGTMRRTSRGTVSGYGTTEIGESIDEGTEYSDDDRDLEPTDGGSHVILFEEGV